MFPSFFFLGDDPARLEAFQQKVAELNAGLDLPDGDPCDPEWPELRRSDIDPLEIARFDLELPGQAAQGLLELSAPPMLGSRKLVVWRNVQVLKSDKALAPLAADLLDVRAPRRSPLVQIVGEGLLPAPKGKGGGGTAGFGFPEPIELLLRGSEVTTFFLPSLFDDQAQLQAVLAAAEAQGLRLTREQAREVLLRLGPNCLRLRPALASLAAAAAGGPVTGALLRTVIAGTHADARGLFQALLRGDRAQVMQLARQLEAGGEGGVAICRRLQALAWEAVVLKVGASAETSVLGEALGISSGAAYYRRKDLASVPRARVEALLEAITALAAEQVKPAGKALPLALQLQRLLAA